MEEIGTQKLVNSRIFSESVRAGHFESIPHFMFGKSHVCGSSVSPIWRPTDREATKTQNLGDISDFCGAIWLAWRLMEIVRTARYVMMPIIKRTFKSWKHK